MTALNSLKIAVMGTAVVIATVVALPFALLYSVVKPNKLVVDFKHYGVQIYSKQNGFKWPVMGFGF